MAAYDYRCSKGHVTEVRHGIKDAPLTICPRKECRAKARRLISRTYFTLKGKGWASDGYGSGEQKKERGKLKHKQEK